MGGDFPFVTPCAVVVAAAVVLIEVVAVVAAVVAVGGGVKEVRNFLWRLSMRDLTVQVVGNLSYFCCFELLTTFVTISFLTRMKCRGLEMSF